MGWWDEGIMGGDTPMDVESYWDETFEDPRAVSSKQARKFIVDLSSKWQAGVVIPQVVGFLMIEGSNKMSKKLKKIVVKALEEDDVSGWNNPELRQQRLDEFKLIVQEWDGKNANMPASPCLFETMFGEIGDLE